MDRISLAQLIPQLNAKLDLTNVQAEAAACQLAEPKVAFSEKYAFLLQLSIKGATAGEVAAFARYFRQCAIDPEVDAWAGRAIDVCGTGGDNAGTFNISTAVSFVVAACGVPVFKHGNRSITSQCGSADLLQALGFPLTASKETLQATLAQFNYAFFFAPEYHPAFKAIMPVRKALAQAGKRTLFNLLGPMINPGKPAFQLMGVFDEQWIQPIAAAMEAMGSRGGWIVHGKPEADRVLDELSCAGSNYAQAYGEQGARKIEIDLRELQLEPCGLGQLLGGDTDANHALLLDLLSPQPQLASPGLRASVLLNAGAALLIAGQVSHHRLGVQMAAQALDQGTVRDWLNGIQKFHQTTVNKG